MIISEAEIKSEKIIEKANQELANIRNGILDLKKQTVQFDSAMRSLIETHLKMLDIEREEIEKDG